MDYKWTDFPAQRYEFISSLGSEKIPERMCEAINRYLVYHIEPGHFLRAVLENDLLKACQRADEENLRILHVYIGYLYNHAPSLAWGSPEAVEKWLKSDPA